jgi:hypothetical protein
MVRDTVAPMAVTTSAQQRGRDRANGKDQDVTMDLDTRRRCSTSISLPDVGLSLAIPAMLDAAAARS